MTAYRQWLACMAAVLMATTTLAHPGNEAPPAEAASAASAPETLVSGVMVRYRDASRRETIRGIEVRRAVPVGAALMETRRQRLATLLELPVDGVKLVRQLPTGTHVFALSRQMSPASLASRLVGRDAEIDTVTPNGTVRVKIATAAQVRQEPFYPLQWNLQAIGLPAALAQADGTGVVVAVLDSGRVDHPDLTGQWLPGRDFVNTDEPFDGDGPDADPTDIPNPPGRVVDRHPWHGVRVASVLAARRDGEGMVGVAPGARLLPVRVVEGRKAEDADVIAGIYWAIGMEVDGSPLNPTPAHVLNLSLGQTAACPDDYQHAVDHARANGVVVVAAAGNDGSDAGGHTPSNCRGVISVGAALRNGTLAGYSNNNVDIVAPGGRDWHRPGFSDILVAGNQGVREARRPSYEFTSATSIATPHVAGVVALMLQLRPGATPEQIEAALFAGARPMQDCKGCGAGLLNAPGALDRIRELVDTGRIAVP